MAKASRTAGLAVLALSLALATAASEWHLALKSRVKADDTFAYDSDIWETGAVLNEFDTSDTLNVLTSEYSTILLEKVQIIMNDATYTFNMGSDDTFRYTLQDLVTRDGGYQFSSSYGWKQSSGNYFGYDSSERTAYTKYCHEFGFNYMNYEDWVGRRMYYTPRVRIGVFMDDSSSCYYPTTAEGIGLDANYGAYALTSGRLQWNSPWTFSSADIYVYGRTEDRNEEQLYFTAWWNYPYDYQISTLRYKVFDTEDISVPYSLQFHVSLTRGIRWWGVIVQIAQSSWERSPRVAMYPNYNEDGYYNMFGNWEHSYYWYTGRRFHCSFKSTASNYDGFAPHGSIPLGRWTSFTLTAHWDHVVGWINGEPQYVYQINGDLNPVETGIPWMSNTAWHAHAQIYGMRFYNDRTLHHDYIQELAAAWPPISCSDGERAYGEQCDDGNKLDGDGCSSSCELEPGFVCRGQTLWGVGADRCEEGTQNQFYTFDGGAAGYAADWTNDGSAATWEVVSDDEAWAGDGALRISNRKDDTGVTYTYAEFDIDGDVNERSFLEFAMRFRHVPTSYFNLAVTVYDKASNGGETLDPSDCHSSPYCDDVVFYRTCFNRRHWRYCDEVRPEVPNKMWAFDTLDFAEGFYEKYEFLPSELPTSGLTVQFSLYTSGTYDDSWGEVWIDNVGVQSPTESYPYQGLLVESYAYGDNPYVVLEVGGVDHVTAGGGDGFNVLLVDGTTHDVLEGPLSFADSDDMAAYVLGLKRGIAVLMGTKTPNTCQDYCADAMDYIGGHQYTGATGSMAIIGVTGGNKNSVPFRVTADGDAPARVHSMVRFHFVNDTVTELFYQDGNLGFPVRVDDEAIASTTNYDISNFQTGYLGCYRVGSSREFSSQCYSSWGYNSPANCAKCCGKKGYTYFALWYYYRCYCGDTYGNRDCDFSGECGLPRVHDKWCTDRRTYGDLQQTSGSYYYEAVYTITGRGERIYDYPLTSSITCTDGRSTDRCNYIYDESTGNDYRSNDYTSLTDNYADIEMLFAEARELSHVRIWWYDDTSGHATEWSLSYTTDGTTWVEHHVNTDGHFQLRSWDIVYLPEHLEFLGVKLALLAPGDGSYYRIKEVYFFEPSREHYGQNLPLDQDHLDDSYFHEYYVGQIQGSGAHFKGNEAFKANDITGQAALRFAVLNFEVTQSYMVGIVAYEDGYDSDWFTMTANQGIDSFVQLEHGLSTRPDWVQVQAKATDGNNNGFAFQGIGSVQGTGALAETYGGLLFAYSETSVRLWAPTSSNASITGYIINVQNGWGGEENAQGSESASVRVTAFVAPAPDYDSGWFEMESQSEADAVKVFKHTIGDLLHARVKLMYRPLDGDNAGYSFEAAGCQQTDDDYGTYGGLLFNYNDAEIRVFAPVRNDIAGDNCPDGYRINQITQQCTVVDPDVDGFGHIVNIPDGWAHSSAYQQVSDQAEVRVQIWVLGSILHMPYGTAEFDMSANGLAYVENAHKFSALPIYVKAVVIGEEDEALGFHFEGMGSAQTTDYTPKKNYGGIVFGYSDYYIRAWAPGQSSSSIKHAYGSLVLCSDGYGNGTYAVAQQGGRVRILAYKEYYGMLEYAYVNVQVSDVNEKPNAALIAVDLLESTEAGVSLGQIDAIDEDLVSNITIEVLANEYSDVFGIDSEFNVIIADASILDYETIKYFDVYFRLYDDDIVVDTLVAVTVLDGNDRCQLWPPFAFEVEEESPVNTIVGQAINATDEDFGQSILFSLDPDVTIFRISTCGGEIFVLDSMALDHEDIVGYSYFDLRVWAIDDGKDAVNTSAIIQITVTDINDEPEWLTPIYLEVYENSPPGTVINGTLNQFAYDVDEGDYLNYTITQVESAVIEDDSGDIDGGEDGGADDGGQEPTFTGALLYVNDLTSELTVGTVELNFESSAELTIYVTVTDGNPNGQLGTPNLEASAEIGVTILDANDPPIWEGSLERAIFENSPGGTVLDTPVIANDEDVNDYVTYEMVDGQGLFDIDPDTGVIWQLNDTNIDYEQTQEVVLTVLAYDHGILTGNVTVGEDKINYVYANVTVTVYDVNEAPTVEGASFEVYENSEADTFLLPNDAIVTSDPDIFAYDGGGQDVALEIVDGNTDDEVFKFNSLGQLKVNNPVIDYEGDYQSYQLTVRGTDDGVPALSDDAIVNITVLDVNDPPDWQCSTEDPDAAGYCQSMSLLENSPTGTAVGVLNATDPERARLIYTALSSVTFDVEDNSTLVVNSPTLLDFEVTEYLDVECRAEDDNADEDLRVESTAIVRVFVLDVDEPPDVVDYVPLIVSKDAINGDPVGRTLEVLANPYYEPTDYYPEGRSMDPDSYSVLTFGIAEDLDGGGSYFSLNPATGQFKVVDSTPMNGWDSLSDPSPPIWWFTINVTDQVNTVNFSVSINVTDLNTAPQMDAAYTVQCPENTPAGYECSPVVQATDSGDPEQVLTYSIILANDEFTIYTNYSNAYGIYYPDADPSPLTLKQGVGIIRIKFDNALNFEEQNEYVFDVLAEDNAPALVLAAQTTVTVEVVDVNDVPEPQAAEFNVTENAAVGTVVGANAWFDQDAGAVLAFSIVDGDDAGVFEVVSTGDLSFELRVAGDVDYETQTLYELEVQADDGAAQASAVLTVYVQDVNEPPVISGHAMNVDENVARAGVVHTYDGSTDYLLDIVDPDRDHADGTTRDQLSVTITSGDDDGDFKVYLKRTDGHQFYLAASSASSFDFEDVESYTVEVLVQETDTAELLSTTATYTVSVNNLNDVTIERYDADDDDEPESPFDVIDGTGLLPTGGGARVNITGTNFGNMHTPEPVEATYGATGVEYTADCEVVPGGNTMLSCLTPAGVGRKHIWHVVTNPDTWAHDTRSDAIAGFEEFYTAYQAPAITDVTLVTSAGGYMRTEGGDTLVITGTNFGRAADTTPQFAGVAELDATLSHLSSTMTAANREDCVAGRSFLELEEGDALALSPNGEYVAASPLAVLTVLHPSTGAGLSLTPTDLRRAPCVTGSDGYFQASLSVSPDMDDDNAETAFVGETPLSVFGFVPPTVLLRNLPSMKAADESPDDDEVLEGVELRAEDCVISTDHTTIECTVPAGVGAGFEVEVLAGAQLSAAYSAATLDYHTAIVTEVVERDVLLDTQGGEPLTLIGAFFGDQAQFAGYGHGLVTYATEDYGTYEAECTVLGSSAGDIDVVTASGVVATAQRSVLNCTSAPGVSYDLPFEVEVGRQTSNQSEHVVSYRPPEISAMPSSYWPFIETAGGDKVLVRGAELGQWEKDIDWIRYGTLQQFADAQYFTIPYANCDITSTDAREEFTCLTVPGTGAYHHWELSVGGQTSNRYEANSSYSAPIVTDFQVPDVLAANMLTALENFDTAGLEPVSILGRNFGPMSTDPAYTSSYVAPIEAYAAWNSWSFPAVNCSVTESHVELTCWTTEGVGTLLKWSVFIDFQESYTASTSYGPPDLWNVTGPGAKDAETVGGQLMYLRGENFGPCDDCSSAAPKTDNFLDEITYGADGDEYEVTDDCWVSIPHEEITCVTAPGVGKNLRFFVTIGAQRMTDESSLASPTMSYAAPNVTGVYPTEGSTTGGYYVTVSGNNFGPRESANLQFWGKDMKFADYDEDEHRWAVFEMPEGQDVMHELVVSQVSKLDANSQWSNAGYWNYTLPIIDRLITQEGSTRTSKLLTLYGVELNSLLTNGGKYSSGESFVWTKSDGSTVTFANQVTTFASINTSTDASVDVSTGVKCESTGYLWSHDEITCEVDRVNGTLVVDVGGRWSNVVSFDNPSPIIESVTIDGVDASEATFPTAGGSSMTILGRYFEEDDTNLEIKLLSADYDEVSGDRFMADVLCEDLVLTTLDPILKEGQLDCTIPPGQGADIIVKVVRGRAQSSDWTVEPCFPCFSYSAPDIALYSDAGLAFPITTPTEGLGDVTLQGDNLGESFARVFIEGFEMPVVAQDHDEITFTLPAGVGTEHDLVVMVGGQETTAAATATDDEAITYVAPTLDSVAVTSALAGVVNASVDGLLPTVGGVNITLRGDNFGAADSAEFDDTVTLAHAFGKDAEGFVLFSLYPDERMQVLSWSHDEIVVVAPPGQGVNHTFSISAGGQVVESTPAQVLAYRPPVLTADVFPNRGHTNGRNENDTAQVYLTITGDDFGLDGQTVAFDGVDLGAPEFVDHSTAVFALPEGQGVDVNISLSVGGQTSNLVYFDYFGPQLHWMTPVNGPTSGCVEMESAAAWIARTDGFDPEAPAARRNCDVPATITVHGRSLGHKNMVVRLGSFPDPLEWDCATCVQNHTTATFEVPPWYGLNHNVTLQVEGRVSNGLRFDYDAPELLSSNPGSLGRLYGYQYANAIGDQLVISGNNFGAVETEVNVTINGIECLDSQWRDGVADSADDMPYVWCESQTDVVGAKNVTLQVAEQEASFYIKKTLTESLINTICKEVVQTDQSTLKYYGAYGEVCLPCPEGAQCSPYYDYLDPWALEGFWREYYDSATDTALDYCEPERLERDECPAFLPCEPEYACKGFNECNEGYEYMIYECQDYQANRGVQTCESDLDCDPNPTKECSYKKPYQCTECVFPNDLDLSSLFGDDDSSAGSASASSAASGSVDNSVGVCTCIPAIRCSLCTVREYFKLDGKCEPCPSNPWVLIIGFACGAVFACIAGYILNRKKFNLAFLSIGVDYFQVLALFASADVAWPTLVLDIFRWLSIFNFNIDITAPECAMPDLQYEDKWQGIMLLPMATLCIITVAYIYKQLSAKCSRGNNEVDSDTLVAAYLVMFYYLYLTLTKKALDIFHCVPVEPDDGYTYASFTSVNCETGLCRCWEPDGVQMTLFPWAVICFIGYSLGFPFAVATIILTNKTLIKEDQILRAKGLEHTKPTKTKKGSRAEKAYHIRARYHKLYYHFKPGKVYWILLIINRKFWIALSGLMFADNPAFQFAVILLVLFMSYVMQVKHRPFMSTVERAAVIKAHQAKAETSRKHMRIATAVQNEEEKKHERTRARKAGLEGHVKKSEEAKSYFWDYNTVEAYLLACAILICLAGIMFDASSDTDRPDLEAHRVFITYATIIVIFFSLGYYFLVFFSEVFTTFGVNEWWITKKLMDKNAHAHEEEVFDDSDVVMGANPMLAANTAALMAAQRDAESAEIELTTLGDTNKVLLEQLANAKQREQEMAAMGGTARRPKIKKNPRAKREFAPTQA